LKLFSCTRGNRLLSDSVEYDFKLIWLLSQSSTDPQRGALDAVLQSGELRYIRIQAIREKLAGWPQLIVDATENEELLRKTWGPLFNQALAKQVDLARIDMIGDECWIDIDKPLCAVDEFEIPYDTELIGYLIKFGVTQLRPPRSSNSCAMKPGIS